MKSEPDKPRETSRIYKGEIIDSLDRCVTVGSGRRYDRLPLCLDIANHSPAGFSWGHDGSGPAQLALAILCDAIDPERALPLHQQFKFEKMARLDQHSGWKMTLAEVMAWVDMAGGRA